MSDPSRTGRPLRETHRVDASNVIAIASLGLAGLTVLLTYLNVRRQADASIQIDHVRWLREKRDDVYGQLMDVLRPGSWEEESGVLDRSPEVRAVALEAHQAEVDRLMRKLMRYASDPVFKNARVVQEELRGHPGALVVPTPTVTTAIARLLLSIRSELVGPEGAKKKA